MILDEADEPRVIARGLWRVLGWRKAADVARAILATAKQRSRERSWAETPPLDSGVDYLVAAHKTPAWKWDWAWRKAVSKGLKLSSLKSINPPASN
jgi:hypothetical protein